jgi:8-oxo-dGTP diphosphatase
MEQQHRFNIRVYGILHNDLGQVLLVHEKKDDFRFTKFPGGGLEWGEGIVDCLVREFREETGLEIKVDDHFYTTGFFQQSAFRKTDQLISIYYKVTASGWASLRLDEHEVVTGGVRESFRFAWVPVNELDESMLTFPVDKYVSNLLKAAHI